MKVIKKNLTKECFLAVNNYIKTKKYEDALKHLDKLHNEDQDIVNKFKGLVYLNKKDWKNSLIYYQKISEDKYDFEISNNIGVALFKLGKFSEASNKFEKSIIYNKSYIPAYENVSLSHKLLGNYNLSIKFIIKALKLMPDNNKIKNYLIDIFNYYDLDNDENYIININTKIKNLNLIQKEKKIINKISIKKILEKSQEILNNKKTVFNFPETQIFRRNKLNLNCERHLSIFAKHKIIPKFCFECYKIQITLINVIDLLKLYFYFNNLNLQNNNIRKCVVELRKNVSGNYKGYIFTNSLKESEEIIKLINNDLSKNSMGIKNIEIKHGCTEYYEEYELYKDINNDFSEKIYQSHWINIEKEFDKKNLIEENNKERTFNFTLNKFNLPDFLIIKNWLLYAKIIGDESYKEIFKFEIDTNRLAQTQKEIISLRKKIH